MNPERIRAQQDHNPTANKTRAPSPSSLLSPRATAGRYCDGCRAALRLLRPDARHRSTSILEKDAEN
ncbi:hypothetical protein GQ55_5G007500 [Panicum hallii var. hallii]|uniref:Uncharacterized protein n=1 Tax=Panicum hallii var. hallii TaxID=1504633 RepID=A0A2T7DBB9_9POAL|nr:hypothetical protein GQ55_5G007500 [Panicum hallii var. hallii]